MWQFTGGQRPPIAVDPGLGQESVWDYPRPPIAVPDTREVTVWFGKTLIAKSSNVIRILETASPPTVYIPASDVSTAILDKSIGNSFCEWKGQATYWSATVDDQRLKNVGWSYENPTARFSSIRSYLSFYPALVDCYIDGERVRPQPGGFYGGWVTDEVVGPYKGEPGTSGW